MNNKEKVFLISTSIILVLLLLQLVALIGTAIELSETERIMLDTNSSLRIGTP